MGFRNYDNASFSVKVYDYNITQMLAMGNPLGTA